MRNYLMNIQPRTGLTGQIYNKWIGFILEALSCYDVEHDKWLHLPTSGGYYDQDDFLMGVWEYIRLSLKLMRVDKNVIEWNKSKAEIRQRKK